MFGAILGSIGLNALGGYLGSRAAKKAANAQVEATQKASGLMQQYGQQALGALGQGYEDQQDYQRQFLAGGQQAFNTLSQLNAPGGELAQGFQFRPEQLTADPGYQFRLQQGQQALERAASARGLLNSGGTLKALTRYNQDAASQEFGNAYGRAFNEFQTNQSNRFNRLASLSGMGQQAAGVLTNAAGNYGSQAAGVNQNMGAGLADLATQAGNARASGYMGSGNAWQQALGGAANAGMSLSGLQQLRPPAPTTGPVIYPNLNNIPLPAPVRY